MISRSRLGLAAFLAVTGCTDGSVNQTTALTTITTSSSTTSAGTTGGPGSSTTDATGTTTTSDGSSSTGVTPKDCWYAADDFGAAMQELDVPPGSAQRLTFMVRGLPDPAVISAATLHFDSHDADHPGEEGQVFVNSSAPYDLPADAGWDNVDATGSIDVLGSTAAGDNVVEFGAGSFSGGTFYRIGNVQLQVQAALESCPAPPDAPPVERTVHYADATYTKRHNWVLRCAAGFDYAYTAKGDEHIDLDCDGLYAPDGSRTGTATFSFPEVVPATYEVQIRSRHTANRNPMGALFVVDGVGKRIAQNDDQDFTTDIWGDAILQGDVEVVLDATMEDASDSVIWVKLVPKP